MLDESWVLVERFNNHTEASVILGMLRSHGVNAVLYTKGASPYPVLDSLTGFGIYVPLPQEALAFELIQSPTHGND